MGIAPGNNESYDPCNYRIERLLQAGGYVGPKCIDQTQSTDNSNFTTAATDVAGQQATTSVSNIVTSDGGNMYVPGDGNLFYRSARYSWGAATSWTLGENTGSGEIPYQPDAAIGYDPSLVANSIALTQSSGPTVTPSTSLAGYIAASQGRFGTVTYQPTVYLWDLDAIGDLANWIAETEGIPSLRAEQVTIDAASYPTAWPLLLYGDIGDVVVFHRRPVNMGPPAITLTTQIIRLHRTLSWKDGTGTIQLTLSPYFGAALSTNSATLGYPNGTVILAK